MHRRETPALQGRKAPHHGDVNGVGKRRMLILTPSPSVRAALPSSWHPQHTHPLSVTTPFGSAHPQTTPSTTALSERTAPRRIPPHGPPPERSSDTGAETGWM